MNTQRKLQLSAAAVVANGLVVLGMGLPIEVVADACSPQSVCGVMYCAGNYSLCNAVAPAGCTFVSATCTTIVCGYWPGGQPLHLLNCTYQ